MKHWLVLALFATGVFFPASSWAQTRTADSLRALLRAQTRPDTVRVRRLQALSGELIMKDLPQAIAVLEQALALSRRLPDPRGEGQCLIRLGTLYRLHNEFVRARQRTQQAMKLFAQRKDTAGLGVSYLQLSYIEMVQENPAAGLRAALEGLSYAEHAHDRRTQTRLQLALGNTYMQLSNYPDALTTLQATLRNAQAQHDEHMVAAALSLLGNTYKKMKKWPIALGYYRRAVQLNRRLGDWRSVTIDETSQAELYADKGDYPQALRHGLMARSSARDSKDAYTLPPAEVALARAYLFAEQPDSAIALARHGFALSQAARSNETLRNASDVLAQAYAQKGQWEPAYCYHRQWSTYQDSLVGLETQKKTSALFYNYALEKKQDQIALLTQARQLQRQQLYGLLAGLVGTVLVTALLGRNIYLKQQANRALNKKNDHIARQRDSLNRALFELKATQTQLVQSEKMVALAALTAGVAHEIQNPLNFVNNFSEVSLELVTELEEGEQKPVRDPVLESLLLGDLKQNLRKIHHHGCRAGDIVKGMLEHAHTDTGHRQPVDLNALVRDYLRLAYLSLQAKHRNLSVTRTVELGPGLEPLHLVPQEIGRVLLNLFTNAFYAVQQKLETHADPSFTPEVQVTTRRVGTNAELRVRDNGTGIPAAVLKKIFDPFFTTKPPGDGTGLGLWLCYDIVTKGYGGSIAVQSAEAEYTEFVVTLPLAVEAAPAEPESFADTDSALHLG
jgi:signal transduction histidine kinase